MARPGFPVIAVVGRKGTGKTRVVEALTRALAERGYRVVTAKHVPEEGFSLDRPGKDTWRHAEAGAAAVLLVAPGEVDTLRRARAGEPSFDDVLSLAARERPDVLILEGFRSMAGARADVPKIVVVSGPEEARGVLADGSVRPVLAFVGPGEAEGLEAPYMSHEELHRLVELVEETVRAWKRAGDLRARLIVRGKEVPLNRFVSEVLRKLVLAFISCLKGVDIKGDERVEVLVE